MRDIDAIISELMARHPQLSVEQLRVAHPGVDDDGIWFFHHPSTIYEVQLESSQGMFPFLAETDRCNDRLWIKTIDMAVEAVESWLGIHNPKAEEFTRGRFHKLYRASCVVTVVFNTFFAALTIITLLGIVFITKPKHVMHEIPPWAWLPLLIVMAPAQVYSQVLAWRKIAAKLVPTPLAIAESQIRFPALLRPCIAIVWLINFVLGVGIVVSLSRPQPGVPIGPIEILVIALLSFWLSFAANVYLLLAIKTMTDNKRILRSIARRRLLIDVAITILAIVYYL